MRRVPRSLMPLSPHTEGIVALGSEHKEPLIEQHVDHLPPGALDHELGARLSENPPSFPNIKIGSLTLLRTYAFRIYNANMHRIAT